jgi:hypothetical protein
MLSAMAKGKPGEARKSWEVQGGLRTAGNTQNQPEEARENEEEPGEARRYQEKPGGTRMVQASQSETHSLLTTLRKSSLKMTDRQKQCKARTPHGQCDDNLLV